MWDKLAVCADVEFLKSNTNSYAVILSSAVWTSVVDNTK